MGTPIVAYGAAVRTGYADVAAACSTADSGTQLKDGAGNAIQLMDDEDAYFLAKNPATAEGHIYNSDGDPEANGFANGQILYLPAQTLAPPIGGRTTVSAGYYTLTAVAIGGGINVFRVDSTALADATACPYTFGTDVGADKAVDPGGKDGPTISRYTNINADYGKKGIAQVPFSLQTAGPFSIKMRGVYKLTQGESK